MFFFSLHFSLYKCSIVFSFFTNQFIIVIQQISVDEIEASIGSGKRILGFGTLLEAEMESNHSISPEWAHANAAQVKFLYLILNFVLTLLFYNTNLDLVLIK